MQTGESHGRPLNILITPQCPTLTELEKIGVARVSAGSTVIRAALRVVERIGKEMLESRSCEMLFDRAIPWADLSAMMSRGLPQ